MKKRIISLVLTVALLFGAMCTLGITAGAETTAPELNIAYANISLRDSIALKFAVPETAENVKLLIWTAPETEYTLATADVEITEYNTVDCAGHMTFDYTGVTAKQMTDVIYARAYANIGGVDTYGDVVKYSVLQYAYNMLAKNTTEADFVTLLNAMLAYGAAAQTNFNYKADRLATADWYKVSVTEGTVDGFKSGLYFAGDLVTLVAPETDANGYTFAGWKNSAGTVVGETATFELTVTGADTYTPAYADPNAEPEMPTLPEWPTASEGLSYYTDDEYNFAAIDGIGDCTDTVIVIPAELDGYPVTDIDPSAFAGESMTAVYIPNTVTTIGNKAFQNCSELTDVYYNGTPAEWEENVSLGKYNTPITNATMHFNPFLVTFVDYDRRVLKYEYVEAGESATAPADPARENYVFAGWNVDFSAVESALTVVAQYKYDTEEPCIIISDAVAVDGVATLTVSIQNNPGVAAINMTLDETSRGMLDATENGTILPTLDAGLNLFWSADDDCEGDGVLVTLTFAVDGLEAGTYPVTFKLNEVVSNLVDVAETFTTVNGSIIVK